MQITDHVLKMYWSYSPTINKTWQRGTVAKKSLETLTHFHIILLIVKWLIDSTGSTGQYFQQMLFFSK